MFSAPGILRVKIRQALAAIAVQERAEARHHEKLLGKETHTARATYSPTVYEMLTRELIKRIDIGGNFVKV